MPPSYEATSNSSPISQLLAINGHTGVRRTKILLLGLRRCFSAHSTIKLELTAERSGKTSIQQVIFNNLPPKQTFYLESTMRIAKHNVEYVQYC